MTLFLRCAGPAVEWTQRTFPLPEQVSCSATNAQLRVSSSSLPLNLDAHCPENKTASSWYPVAEAALRNRCLGNVILIQVFCLASLSFPRSLPLAKTPCSAAISIVDNIPPAQCMILSFRTAESHSFILQTY